MYEELVKKMRQQCADMRCGNCNTCLNGKAADAIEELMKAAKAMHTWIFLNTGDEQAAYDECRLSDEMNASLGYYGAYELREEHKPQTNADRIRAMSDEELADELLSLFADFYEVEWSKDAVLDWLKAEVKE